MALLDVDPARGTFDHACHECGLVRRGLSLDPAAGDLRVEEGGLVVAPCPACAALGFQAIEVLNRWLLPHEAGEGAPPGSLVGTLNAAAGTVVIEHYTGSHGGAFRQRQASLIRTMQRHPALAKLAPLMETLDPVTGWPGPVRMHYRHHLDAKGHLLPVPTLPTMPIAEAPAPTLPLARDANTGE